MNKHSHLLGLLFVAIALILLLGQAPQTGAQGPVPQAALGTGFTYQGQLNKSGVPVTDTCNFTFSLWDSPSNATGQVGASQTVNSIAVAKGLFTVVLNGGNQFGASAFTGQARWLQTAVKCTGDSSPITLSRQQLTAAPFALFASAPWVTTGNNLYYTLGNVGIGTSLPIVLGVPTGLKVGTAAGTIPFALRQNSAESTTPTLAYFETSSGDLGFMGAEPSTFVIGAASAKAMALKVNGSTTAMTINSFGDVGIGTSNPLATMDVNGSIRGTSLTAPTDLFLNANGRIALRTSPSGQYAERMTILDNGNIGIGTTNIAAKLHVRSAGTTNSTLGFRVDNGNGNATLAVTDGGEVYVGHLGGIASSEHVCIGGAVGGVLDVCGSAAEYVPTINSGLGYPETADLVSIAPAVSNPYGDTHGPFIVQKSSAACDPNLLGYIVKPESGADGEKKNEHYLPLAIYGYFPAKVTLENGAIKRGDPLTSSSKPGYAMKATSACKIIGYALEDASGDGTIQVFAHLSENAASQVASLRTQVDDLKKQNDALAARLDAIERGQAPLQSGLLPRDALLWGTLAVVGVVLARRWKR